MDVYETISRAGPGSDIHSVLEKIAYRMHLGEPRAWAEANWNDAKQALVNYVRKDEIIVKTLGSIELYIKQALDLRAYSFRNFGGTQFDHWISAQNDLSQEISDDYNRMLDEQRRLFETQCVGGRRTAA